MNAASTIGLAVILFALSAAAHADIWGFVDEHGVAHLSDHQVDERYYLFKKEVPAPSPLAVAAGSAEADGLVAAHADRINRARRTQLAPLVSAVAKEHGIDAALLHAVIAVESGYNTHARSSKGAAGLMQLMPETAQRYAVKNVWDPRDNLHGGARYLRDLIALFRDNLSLALAAYNAGEAAVVQAGNRIPPYPETRSFVPKVLDHYARYRVQQF